MEGLLLTQRGVAVRLRNGPQKLCLDSGSKQGLVMQSRLRVAREAELHDLQPVRKLQTNGIEVAGRGGPSFPACRALKAAALHVRAGDPLRVTKAVPIDPVFRVAFRIDSQQLTSPIRCFLGFLSGMTGLAAQLAVTGCDPFDLSELSAHGVTTWREIDAKLVVFWVVALKFQACPMRHCQNDVMPAPRASSLGGAQGKELLRSQRAAGVASQDNVKLIPDPLEQVEALGPGDCIPLRFDRSGIGEGPAFRRELPGAARQVELIPGRANGDMRVKVGCNLVSKTPLRLQLVAVQTGRKLLIACRPSFRPIPKSQAVSGSKQKSGSTRGYSTARLRPVVASVQGGTSVDGSPKTWAAKTPRRFTGSRDCACRAIMQLGLVPLKPIAAQILLKPGRQHLLLRLSQLQPSIIERFYCRVGLMNHSLLQKEDQMIGKKPRFWLKSFTAVLALIFTQASTGQAQDAAMQDDVRPQLFYSISINAENMFAIPRVNGAPLLTHGRFRPLTLTTDITRELQPGRNLIQIDYEPFDMNKQSFTPHGNVRLQVVMSRSSNFLASTRIKEEITLFSGRYDPETATLVQTEESVFGEGPIIQEDGGLRSGRGFELEPVTITYLDAQSRGKAMRLTLAFDIFDIEMSTPPWTNARVLSDTPTLREDLWRAYTQVHQALASGNPANFALSAEPLLAHNALVLGYESASEMAQIIDDRQPLAGDVNRQLLPMMPAIAASTAQIEFSPDGRLVQFMSAPLGYETSEGTPAGRFNYWFCQIGDQPLAPCFVQDFG